MTTRSALKKVSSFITAGLLLSLPTIARSDDSYQPPPSSEGMAAADDSPEAAPATGAVYARLKYLEGGLSLKRDADSTENATKLEVNSPLIPGDQIWTAADGRAEVQLADGSILRLDRNARLTFQNLADREASIDNTTLIRLINGSLYVRADNFDPRNRRFQIDTPGGSIFLLSAGVFRIDVTPDGVSTVGSFRGVAEVLGNDLSVMTHSGERVSVQPGQKPTEARAFNTMRHDPFDAWSEDRDDSAAGTGSARGPRPEVPEPVKPYVSELSSYGAWRYDGDYGWTWVPDNQASDWRPYYDGQWTYAPIGPTWVSYEPWGWAPYHYGRWHWGIGVGWFWIPGYVYSGAYVSWSVGPSFWGWCPLGFYDSPVFVYNAYPWTYVPYGAIYYPHVNRYSYGWSDVARNRMNQNSYVLHGAPSFRPGYRPESVGMSTYRRVLANPGAATPASQIAATRGTPFRGSDQMAYRRIAARRATPEPTSLGGRPGLAPSTRSMPAVRPMDARSRPMVDEPGARIGGPRGAVRATPADWRGANAGGQRSSGVSPVTGRPIQPPVRMLAPESRSGGPGEESALPRPKRGASVAPSQGDRQPITHNGRVGSAAAPQVVSPRAAEPSPHPRLEPGRNGNGRGSFVMPTRPAPGVSKPSTVGPRPAPRSAPSAHPAPAQRPSGQGKKGGRR